MKQIYLASTNVLKEKNYFLASILIAIIFFGLFVFIPVFTIPGNDFSFQFSIYSQRDYVLMFLLAFLVGISFALQVYIFRKQKVERNFAQSTGQVAVSGLSGIFGAMVGTAACTSCLAFFFGLLGFGTGSVFFVLENQSYFLIGAIILMFISLYFMARKVNNVCESCHIDKNKIR